MPKDKNTNRNNIWDINGFKTAASGKPLRIPRIIRYFFRCIKWSGQRVTRGYAECDVWEMHSFLQKLIPDMLQTLKETRNGSPGYLGENYTNDDGILVNDTCHEEWDKILDRMIFLWHETVEETCSKQNPYEEEYLAAFEDFTNEYGLLGEKLRTPEEIDENNRTSFTTVHFMSELQKYKEIDEKHSEEEKMLEEYRSECKNKAIDMLNEHFFSLWD